MAVSAILKQAKLRQLYRKAVTDSATLLVTLNAALDAAVARVSTGTVMTGNSGNGFSGSFQILKDFSPEQALETVTELLSVYDAAKVDLADDGTESPTDLEIHDRMLLLLKPITEARSDFSQMCLS